MTNDQTCPDRNVFVDFLAGKLEEDRLQSLEAHLAECDACGDTVRSMNVNDTFLEIIRVNDQVPDIDASDDTEVGALVQKLESLADSRGTSAQSDAELSDADSANATTRDETDLRSRVHEVQSLLSPSESDEEIGRLAHYRILELLGAGGMGVVYQAEDTQLQRMVALKVLRPSLGCAARERFLQEARAAAAIEHDNVVTIYNVGNEGPLAFLAMQFLDGETLESRLKRDGRLSADEVIHVGSQIADGLAAAHAKKLIHRDIKPANILISADRDRATILDFGLAYAVDDNPELTETGMIAGTPAYMSPEQAQGRPVDERSDLFSLGTMMYRMLTGKLPFAGTNALATIRSIQNDDPTPPRQVDMDLPATLSDTVMDLLEKDARSRPGNTQSVADALRNRTRPPVRQKADTEAQLQPSRGKGGRILATAAACGGLIAAAMVYQIQTDKGQITVKTEDPNIQVEVLQGGDVVNIIDPSTNDTVTVKSGSYQLALKNPSSEVRLVPGEVTVTRDGRETVSVSTSFPLGPSEANKIGVGSFLKIECGADSTFNAVRQVEHSGEVAVMSGVRVPVKGMTYEEAEAAIEERLKAVFTEPRILVSVPDDHRPLTQVPETIEPGALVWFSSRGAGIHRDLRVEPTGTVALGPGLPRVAVAGLTFEQAEQRINHELKSSLREPKALLTLSVNSIPSRKVGQVLHRQDHSSESGVSTRQTNGPEDANENGPQVGESAEELLLEFQAMRDRGDAAKAIPRIHKLLFLHDFPELRLELGRCYVAIGELELALAEYAHVIRQTEGRRPKPDWLFERGKVYESKNALSESLRDYERAFALDPTNEKYVSARKRVRELLREQQDEASKLKNTIQPGDQIHIAVTGAIPEEPIDGLYLVEPAGTVPLGPAYGRANVANRTVEQAEVEITKVLKEILQNPQVMVTSYADVRQTSLKLKHATAETAAKKFRQLHPNSRVQMVPDERTNSLLVVATSQADLGQLTHYIEQIDKPSSSPLVPEVDLDQAGPNGESLYDGHRPPNREAIAKELAALRAARDRAKEEFVELISSLSADIDSAQIAKLYWKVDELKGSLRDREAKLRLANEEAMSLRRTFRHIRDPAERSSAIGRSNQLKVLIETERKAIEDLKKSYAREDERLNRIKLSQGDDGKRVREIERQVNAIVDLYSQQVEQIKQEMTSRLSSSDSQAAEIQPDEPLFQGKTYSHWLSLVRNERDTERLREALEALARLTENDVNRSKRACEALDIVVSRQPRQDHSVISSLAKAYLACDANVAMAHLIDQLETRNGQLVFNSILSLIDSARHLPRSMAMQKQLEENNLEIFETLTSNKSKSFSSSVEIISQLAIMLDMLDLTEDQVDELLPAFIQELDSGSLFTQVNAATALARYKPDTEGLIESLVRVIGDKGLYSDHLGVRQVAERAFEALSTLGPRAKDSVPTIVEVVPIMTGGESWGGRRTATPDLAKLAVETLLQIGPDAKEAIPMLRQVVKKLEADLIAKERDEVLGGPQSFHPSSVTARDGTKMTEVIELAKKAIVEIGGEPVEASESNGQSAAAASASE